MNSFDLFGNPQEDRPLDEQAAYATPSFTAPVVEMEEAVERDLRPTHSFAGTLLFIALVTVVLGTQTFRLQILQAKSNQAQSDENSIRLITLPAGRGLITDINGNILAQNTQQPALAIDPQALPTKLKDRQKVYDLLLTKGGVDSKTVASIEKNYGQSPEVFIIKDNLSKDELLLDEENFANVPGVVVQQEPIRLYANLPSLGHLLGYVGQTNEDDVKNGLAPGQQIGKSGLEQVYNTQLAGVPGKKKAEVNAFGEVVRNLPSGDESEAKTGQTIRLSIDSKLQQIVATALQHGLDRRMKEFGNLKDWGASAVIIDPSTGAIKAMVSLPDYNDQEFAQGITTSQYQALLDDPAHPLVNRAIQDQLPSGSIIKPLVAAAGLQEKVITPSTEVTTPASISIGSFVFPDWKYHTGQSDVRRAIAESNDVFFYALGGGAPGIIPNGLGIDRLNTYLRHFGLGGKVGVDLPGEETGLIADNAWKEKNVGEPWYIGDTYHSAIGQGFTLVTPLQMANATAAIANGGTVWEPRLAWSTIDPTTGKETLLPHPILQKDFVSPDNIEVIREGMRQTVLSGSAQPLKTLTVTSAGKTGTAEFGDPAQGLTHAWFTGFAPYDNPEIAYAVSIEAGGESFDSSLPVVEEILRNYFNDPLAPGQKLNSEPNIKPNPEFAGER